MKATWLYSKHPVIVDTDVAVAIGIKEAVIAQQLNYWLHSKSAKTINGRRWVYNSYENWQKDSFPFFTVATIRRLFEKLEKMGVIITGNYNKAGFDKTKWYSIDEERLNDIINRPSAQNEQTNTRDYTEITTDNNNNVLDKPKTSNSSDGVRKRIIDYLNSKAGVHYKHNANATKRVIDARLKEGYTPADFKAVIDKKVAEWINNPEMSKYLRPTTLFGPKFESYLNQKSVNSRQYQKYGTKRVEKGTDWTKHQASTETNVSSDDLKNFFRNFEEKHNGGT